MTAESLDSISSPNCLKTISLIVEKSKGDRERKPYKVIGLEIKDSASYMHVLLDNVMIGYFIDCYHMLLTIKRWVELMLCRE